MKRLFRLLESQNINTTELKKNISALQAAVVLGENFRPRDLGAFVLAASVPAGADVEKYVKSRLYAKTDDGDTFGEAMQQLAEMEPSRIMVSQITVCHETPWIGITGINPDNFFEFTGPDCQPQLIRTETIISGSLLTAICLKLNGATESGWTGWTHVVE